MTCNGGAGVETAGGWPGQGTTSKAFSSDPALIQHSTMRTFRVLNHKRAALRIPIPPLVPQSVLLTHVNTRTQCSPHMPSHSHTQNVPLSHHGPFSASPWSVNVGKQRCIITTPTGIRVVTSEEPDHFPLTPCILPVLPRCCESCGWPPTELNHRQAGVSTTKGCDSAGGD